MASLVDILRLVSEKKYTKTLDYNNILKPVNTPAIEENRNNMVNLGKCPRFLVAFTSFPSSCKDIPHKKRETFIDTFFDLIIDYVKQISFIV